ncbi:VOC family protein [Schumannella sp. 10F1B-5-1]|uniref:VOC family protein n=1 Tax=Schumannella sp. 10F1B-5-1 TaxID=2590780 RepID=UPI001130138A|nr:VOC family protein [Schumannella sp. 10F1B-5-1]TPW70931.1 VOC family protein [Schumannella sp. 10F1B-5-1]
MLTIKTFVWGVTDMSRAIEFWTAALDYEVKPGSDDEWTVLVPRTGEAIPRFALQKATSDRPRRHHLDLTPDDAEAEIARLVGLGATRVDDWRYEDDADYTVLRDPDGNTFCVLDSE